MGKIFVKAPVNSPDDFAKSISEGAKQFGLGALQSGAAFTDPRQVSSFGDFARLLANPFIAGYRGLTQGPPLTDRQRMELNAQMRREIEERMQGQRTMDKLRALSLDPNSATMLQNFPIGQDGTPASDRDILDWAQQQGAASDPYALNRLARNLEQVMGTYNRGEYLKLLRGATEDEKTGAENRATQTTKVEDAFIPANVGGGEFTNAKTQMNINNLVNQLNEPNQEQALKPVESVKPAEYNLEAYADKIGPTVNTGGELGTIFPIGPASMAPPAPPLNIQEVKFGVGADEELGNDAKQMEDPNKTDHDGENIKDDTNNNSPFVPADLDASPATGALPPKKLPINDPNNPDVDWTDNNEQ